MNFVDLILILLVLLAMWGGWNKGFILGVLDLGNLIGSVVIAFVSYPYLAAFLQQHVQSLGVWTLPFSFITIFITCRLVFAYIIHLILKTVNAHTHQHTFNKFLGLAPGFVNGLIYATILSALLLASPLFEGLTATTRDSRIANRLAIPAAWIESKLSPVFDEAVKRTLNKLTVEPKSNESVNLNFTVTNAKIRPDLEAQMLEMVNEERRKKGLQELKADPELTLVARAHSKDMFARGYFAHITPEGRDPFDRMRAAGVKFLTAGEILALAQTLKIAHNGLMNS
ncbi:MAG: CvpA family protein, partial [Chitinophagaceae bacterium]|nr:CvpA family protein [Chitinophagaceae bacterium]